MPRLAPLTLPGLLAEAERLLRRATLASGAVPACALLAGSDGRLSALRFTVPEDAAARAALAEVLRIELRRRGARAGVLAFEAPAEAPDHPACLVLEGHALAPLQAAVRLLAIERRDGRIVALRPLRPAASPRQRRRAIA